MEVGVVRACTHAHDTQQRQGRGGAREWVGDKAHGARWEPLDVVLALAAAGGG